MVGPPVAVAYDLVPRLESLSEIAGRSSTIESRDKPERLIYLLLIYALAARLSIRAIAGI